MGQSLVKGKEIVKVIYKNIRVLQKRKINDALVSDHDIKIGVTVNQVNRATVGNLVITFNKNIDWIIGNFGIGENVDKFTKVTSTNSISKPFAINVDNNGAGNGTNYQDFPNNYIYLSDLDGITSISISQSASGFASVELQLRSKFPLLKAWSVTVPQNPNFQFLTSIPEITVLEFQMTVNTFQNLPILKASNIIYLALIGFNNYNGNLLASLPDNLYALVVSQMQNINFDFKDFFTGPRIAFIYTLAWSNTALNITYTGGAIFPSNLTDIDKPKAISDIIRLPMMNATNNMNGDAVSRLIVDFANQVNSVTLQNASAKRIVFFKVTPNTSYTDLTQPKFTTYTAALNHITATLGVSVTFYA